jgi:hypothetical protein
VLVAVAVGLTTEELGAQVEPAVAVLVLVQAQLLELQELQTLVVVVVAVDLLCLHSLVLQAAQAALAS